MKTPRIRYIANLWSLWEYPDQATDWPLEKKMEAVKAAGFDGITTQASTEHAKLAEKNGLMAVG